MGLSLNKKSRMLSTIFSPAFTFWILYFLCSIVCAVPAEPSHELFDTSQTDLDSLNWDQSNPDFWNEGDVQLPPNDFATTFPGTSASIIDPGSSDLSETAGLSVFENDPLLTSYADGDATFQDNEIASDAFGASCGPGAQDLEYPVNVDVIAPRDHRDFGDLNDPGEHPCPSGKRPACCTGSSTETIQGSTRMRHYCAVWGEFEDLK